MASGDAAIAGAVFVLAGDREQLPRPAAGVIVPLGRQLRVDTPPNHLSHGHAETLRACSDAPMLRRLELYLKTHHDGMIIPSRNWRAIRGLETRLGRPIGPEPGGPPEATPR